MKKLMILLCALPFLFQACANNDDLETVEAIDELCLNTFKNCGPGAAVLVLRGDDILFDKGYGLADLETAAPIDGNTSFNIASCSKQFTAVAVLQEVEKGAISLDDSVSRFFPEYNRNIFDKVRVRHLLSHSSGLPDKRGYLPREQRLTAGDVLAVEFFKTLDELTFEPGDAYDYQNPTFVLLGNIVSKLEGVDYGEYMSRNVFTPAGMEKTVFFTPGKEETIPDKSTAYDFDEGQWIEEDYGETTFFATRADGGIYSSTHELVRWEQALRSCKLLGKDLLEQAWTPQVKVSGSPYCTYQNRENTWYGFGWFIEPATESSQKVIYHTGDNGGYKALIARYPDSDIMVAVLANRRDWDRNVFKVEMEKILGLRR